MTVIAEAARSSRTGNEAGAVRRNSEPDTDPIATRCTVMAPDRGAANRRRGSRRRNLVLGSAPVSGGIASVSWTPATSGQNAITAGYFDSQLQFLPIAGGAVVTVTPGINIGGFCL